MACFIPVGGARNPLARDASGVLTLPMITAAILRPDPNKQAWPGSAAKKEAA